MPTQIFFIFTPGEDFQFDEHIFQTGGKKTPTRELFHPMYNQEVISPTRKLFHQPGSYFTNQEVISPTRKLFHQQGSYFTKQEVISPSRKLFHHQPSQICDEKKISGLVRSFMMSFDGNGQIRAWHSAKCLVGAMGSYGMGHILLMVQKSHSQPPGMKRTL